MLNRFSKWMWIKLNKKPPTLLDIYMYKLSWWLWSTWCFMFGIICLLILSSPELKDIKSIVALIIVGIMFIGIALMSGWMQVKEDKKDGYTNLMKEFALKKWHEKRIMYGLEKNEQPTQKTEASKTPED